MEFERFYGKSLPQEESSSLVNLQGLSADRCAAECSDSDRFEASCAAFQVCRESASRQPVCLLSLKPVEGAGQLVANDLCTSFLRAKSSDDQIDSSTSSATDQNEPSRAERRSVHWFYRLVDFLIGLLLGFLAAFTVSFVRNKL